MLRWLADCDRPLARNSKRQGYYTQTFLRKRKGYRLVEAPLDRLKSMQRRILRGISNMTSAHPDSFAIVPGRDCRAGHAGKPIVIYYDLQNFFPSIPAARVHAIIRSTGYLVSVARPLTGLIITRSPPDTLAALSLVQRGLFAAPHLPQGAPNIPNIGEPGGAAPRS